MQNRLAVYAIVIFLCLAWVFGGSSFSEVSTQTKIGLEGGIINLTYSTEEDVLKVVYSIDDNECQLTLSSTQRMGLLIEVIGAEITYSLRFLDEEETWPTDEMLENEDYKSKTIFEVPGWRVIVAQKDMKGGE